MENIAEIDCVFFDMDGTLTDIKSPWQRVFEHLNIWEEKGKGYLYGWLKGEMLRKSLKKLKTSPVRCLSAGDSLESDKELSKLNRRLCFCRASF